MWTMNWIREKLNPKALNIQLQNYSSIMNLLDA